jgi:hypothetical protein
LRRAGSACPIPTNYIKDDDKFEVLPRGYEKAVSKMLQLAGEAPAKAARTRKAVLADRDALARSALRLAPRAAPSEHLPQDVRATT